MFRVLLAVSATLFASTAYAEQPQCGPYEEIVSFLADEWHEGSVGMGIDGSGNIEELFVSPERTWTRVSIDGDLQACIVSYGENWTGDAGPLPEGTHPGNPA